MAAALRKPPVHGVAGLCLRRERVGALEPSTHPPHTHPPATTLLRTPHPLSARPRPQLVGLLLRVPVVFFCLAWATRARLPFDPRRRPPPPLFPPHVAGTLVSKAPTNSSPPCSPSSARWPTATLAWTTSPSTPTQWTFSLCGTARAPTSRRSPTRSCSTHPASSVSALHPASCLAHIPAPTGRRAQQSQRHIRAFIPPLAQQIMAGLIVG